MSFGKSPAKKIVSKKTFLDIAGQEELKEEVREVIDFLKRPEKYKAAGAKIPKGILLGGPPGTGKTLTAKAVAGEANVPFFFISASNFVEMFAGMGAKRVREMFKEARKNAPSILFIDEMDAVGRKRGTSLSGNDEREQTLNQILVELDGMIESNGLLVMAATNRPDVLDPALLRPGRFDRTITIGYPDIKERELILRLHAKGKRLSNKIDFKNIAKRTPRYSGADLESVINEATLLSVRENSPIINIEHVDEAIDRVMAGPSKKHRIITPEENKLVAIHEAGHAVIGLKNKDADIVQKITIIPRGEAGGYTLSTPKKEQYNYRKSQFEAKIMGLLGGRAAEQVYYGKGEVTTGAYDDIQKATSLARSMVTQFGMSILGPIAYEKPQGSKYLGYDSVQKDYSDSLAERIDEAVRELIEKAEKKAIEVIEKNKKLLDLIVEELLEKETIVVEEINYINKNLKRPPKKRKIKKINKDKSLNEIIKELKIEKNNKKISKIKKVDKNKSLNKIIKEVKDEKNNKKISKNKKTK
jgi:cell division protease FtsH